MNDSRFTEIQIKKFLRNVEKGCSIKEACREYGVSQAIYEKWKVRYTDKSTSEIKEIRKFETKLDAIYEFLKANRKCNLKVQENFYKSIIASQCTIEDKVVSLLYRIANTQSQPKMDLLGGSFKSIMQDTESLKSFKSFVYQISEKDGMLYKDLYHGMSSCDGWGPKTAALFTKAIFQLHNGGFNDKLRFWGDAPGEISKEDQLYLPVDAVIISIFEKIGFGTCTFQAINKEVSQLFSGPKLEVWDDLWFWGFINQRVVDKERIHEWNDSKYWALEYSNKVPVEVKKIKEKAAEFRELLN